jgi:hypothetical protein
MRMTPPPSGPVLAYLRYSESASAITTYDRDGKPFNQCEWFYDYAVRRPGMQWPEGMPDSFWASYLNMHMYDMKSGRMSRMGIVPEISGGLRSSIDNPRLYEQFCTLEAIRSQGR